MKIINFDQKKDDKKDEKEFAIEFLEGVIKNLKEDKLDPEKCLLFLKWKDGDSESFNYYHNGMPTETILALIEINKAKIINDLIIT
jgi:hypothetical protein